MGEWREQTIWQALEAAAQAHPAKELLVVDAARYTYRDVWQQAQALAAGLHDAGLGRGDVLALWLPNGVEWVVALGAAARLGAIVVSVNTRLREEEVAYLLAQSQAGALVVSHRPGGVDFVELTYKLLPELRTGGRPAQRFPHLRTVVCTGEEPRPGLLPWAALTAPRAAPPVAHPSPHDVALVQYTSGSTGQPKGAMLTHAGLLRDAKLFGDRMRIDADDRFFTANPLFHVAAVVTGLLNVLTHDATLVTMAHYEAGAALALLARERCTARNGLDTMLQRELAHPDYPRHDLRALHKGTMMGSGEVFRRAVERMGLRDLVSQYSLSEASCNVASTVPSDPLAVRATTVGRPLPGVELRLAAPESGAAVAPGGLGEILVRGWNVMHGYWRDPAATAHAIDADGWLHTGDLGRFAADGNLVFAGRLKDVVRVGGENVSALEVENFLLRHPAVKVAQVVGAPDADLGEVPVAFVELHAGACCTEAELLAHCQGRLARFKQPRAIGFISEWPLTGSAKIRKPDLRALAPTLYSRRA